MSKEELEKIIFEVPIPKNWRKGQFVFNRIDELFKVARIVQFKDGIDCFYLDSKIDEFINHSLKYINHE
jgi:hypothetical protein